MFLYKWENLSNKSHWFLSTVKCSTFLDLAVTGHSLHRDWNKNDCNVNVFCKSSVSIWLVLDDFFSTIPKYVSSVFTGSLLFHLTGRDDEESSCHYSGGWCRRCQTAGRSLQKLWRWYCRTAKDGGCWGNCQWLGKVTKYNIFTIRTADIVSTTTVKRDYKREIWFYDCDRAIKKLVRWVKVYLLSRVFLWLLICKTHRIVFTCILSFTKMHILEYL